MENEEPRKIEEMLKKLRGSARFTFPAHGKRLDAPEQKGVYIIYSPEDKVLHVGSTPRAKHGLYQRLSDHLHGNSSFTEKELDGDGSRLRDGCQYQYLVVNDARRRALVEALGIGLLCPEHIGHGLDSLETTVD